MGAFTGLAAGGRGSKSRSSRLACSEKGPGASNLAAAKEESVSDRLGAPYKDAHSSRRLQGTPPHTHLAQAPTRTWTAYSTQDGHLNRPARTAAARPTPALSSVCHSHLSALTAEETPQHTSSRPPVPMSSKAAQATLQLDRGQPPTGRALGQALAFPTAPYGWDDSHPPASTTEDRAEPATPLRGPVSSVGSPTPAVPVLKLQLPPPFSWSGCSPGTCL